ncbi:tetratricopeptide repeat protein [Ancylobacter terrae]|uniref:tetratricopeptide repeat protein n=1 Tax=Ancylobacter sp. sgz301288 TaxID=3342077 RepID=UPI00385A4497
MPDSLLDELAEREGTAPDVAPPEAAPAVVAPEVVREALARVLASEELRSSPQLSTILRFVVEATLDGRSEAIKGYTIAVEAMGRDPSFDPQVDPIVRVEATRLRRSLERYYAGAGAGDEIEIFVPKGSYVPQFRARPAAAGREAVAPAVPADAATAFEPAEGRDVPPGPAIPPPRVRSMPAVTAAAPPRGWRFGVPGTAAIAVAALLLAALALLHPSLAGWRALVAGAPAPIERTNRLGIPMVEVRAFESAGGSGGEFDPRAIEVRVRDALARSDLLDVLATPDARPVIACDDTKARAGSAFALGGLVENHDDGSVAVLLRLSDVCDGTIVWSREFESLRRGTDATATEVALVRDIMAALAEPYGVIQSRARARVLAAGGPEAAGPYGCVLLAYGYWRSYVPADHARARDCLERAVAQDPSFALGHALLGELYLDEVRNEVNPRPGAEPALDRAFGSAERAVELAPTSAFARRVLMHAHFLRGERGSFVAAGQEALELNPYDTDTLVDLAGSLAAFGEIERGAALLAGVKGEVPGMPLAAEYQRAVLAYLRGDVPAAGVAIDGLSGEGYPPGLLARALVRHLAGEDEAARADLKRLVALAPSWSSSPAAMVARFFPDPALAKRVKGDLAAAGLPGLTAMH